VIALILWLLMPHPVVYGSNVTLNRPYPVLDYNPDTDRCAGLESGAWHRCQPRVIYLGRFPAPVEARWPDNKELDAPKSWPEYETEKR
jgi:hypothetical protein